MMKEILYWNITDNSQASIVLKYCHNCGRKVLFRDSKKRRRNANGKTIYEYAIFKCEKDHTWNMPLGRSNPLNNKGSHEINDTVQDACSSENINLMDFITNGVIEIEIIVVEVTGRWRIDKLLADRIQDLSRSKVIELIHQAKILVDAQPVKRGYLLKKHQKITILLAGLFI